MKFVYVGNPSDPEDTHDSVVTHRIKFPLLTPVEVACPHAQAALKENSHFVLASEKATEPVTESDQEPVALKRAPRRKVG